MSASPRTNLGTKIHSVACAVSRKLHIGSHKAPDMSGEGVPSTTEQDEYTTSLEGKVAVVTSSAQSIGASIAKSLAAQGAYVVVNHVGDAKSANSVVKYIKSQKKGKAIAVAADSSTIAGGQLLLDESVKAFGKVDILVVNASMLGSNPLAEVDEADFDGHFRVNVKGPVFLAKAAAALLPAPGGRIIFISSSLTGATPILPEALCYVASKGALDQASRVLAKDLGAKGLTVNTISPGPTDTLFVPPHVLPQSLKDVTEGRNSDVGPTLSESIAEIVAFLASPAAKWVNGQDLRVDGGFVV